MSTSAPSLTGLLRPNPPLVVPPGSAPGALLENEMDEYEFDYETTLELMGVGRPVVARCLASEGSVGVVSVVITEAATAMG